jgi:hypothetical protein
MPSRLLFEQEILARFDPYVDMFAVKSGLVRFVITGGHRAGKSTAMVLFARGNCAAVSCPAQFGKVKRVLCSDCVFRHGAQSAGFTAQFPADENR